MSTKARELESERARSVRVFRLVLAALFAGMALGPYVERGFFMTEVQASWLWAYGRGAGMVSLARWDHGATQKFVLDRQSLPGFPALSKRIGQDVEAYQTIQTNYPSFGAALRNSLLRIGLLWPLLAAALTYTGISLIEARKNG